MSTLVDLGEAAFPAAHIAESKNVPSDALPAAIKAMLRRNKKFSRRFVEMSKTRELYFRSRSFQLVVDCCMDERLLDIALALGEFSGLDTGSFTPPGIIEIMRSAGAKTGLRSLSTCLIESKRTHKHAHAGKKQLRLSLAHWSSSHPDTASCAAWRHNCKAAVEYEQKLAAKLNYCFAGDCVALHGLIDTDYDSITVFGPNGRLDTLEFVRLTENDDEKLISILSTQLAAIFPRDWPPLFALGEEKLITAFYRELAEYLSHNTEYARRNISERRKIQLFEHAGSYILIGRHIESETDHNTAFCLDDHDADLSKGLVIGLKYVGRNSIVNASAGDDWIIPIHINIPHSGDDRRITGEYVLELRKRVFEVAAKHGNSLAAFWLNDEHGVPKKLHRSLEPQLKRGLGDRIKVSVSISDRNDRLFLLDW